MRGGIGQFVMVLMRGDAQEPDLFAVTAAPFADEQMQPEAKPFRQREGMIEGLGLRPRGLTTIG